LGAEEEACTARSQLRGGGGDDAPVAAAFLQTVALGGAAVAVGQVFAESPAAALPCTDGASTSCIKPPLIREIEEVVGQITLGGILNTYVAAPLNCRGALTWSMSTTRTETFRTITEDSRQLSVSLSLGPFKPGASDRFGIGGGFDRMQSSSTKVTDASTQIQTIQTSGTNGGYNTWDNTAFLIMARPVLRIGAGIILEDGIPVGPSGKLYFKFVNGGTIFPRSARELRDDPGTRAFIGPETADSILSQYPLTPSQLSGQQLGLGGPRFGPPTAIAPGSTPFGFTRSMTGTTTHIVERTKTVTTKITGGFSLNLGGVQIFCFEAGKSFTTSHTSVQETSNSEVIATSGILTSDLKRLNFIYEDLVWNTLLITDEGPLGGALAAVSGTVTAAGGAPIEGAVVTMPVNGVTYEAHTDQRGSYAIRVPGGLEPGNYRVTCAGVTNTVRLDRGKTAAVNYPGVTAGQARVPAR
jgi:hypothetical protein